MTTTAPPAAPQAVLTPRTGTVLRRSLFWVGAAVLVIVIGIVAFAMAGSSSSGPDLGPTNAAPAGAMAVAEVLAQQGVDVISTSSLDETKDAIDSRESTTLFIYDDGFYLDDAKLRQAVGLADTVILAAPSFGALQAVAPDVAQAGTVDEVLDADCSLPVIERAETVSGAGSGYRVVDDSADAVTCLGSGDDVYSLVQLEEDGTRLTVLGATGALSNEFVSNDGNAAFALGLLGENDTLVWYLPSYADLDEAGDDTIAELTPPWVIPLAFLLIGLFVVAAFWRGRRFGPLVVENLPVTVRASETMLGRARLYEKSSSRLRALDSLRIGTVQRLALLCGLPRTATVDDVIAAVSSVTGAQPGAIRDLLVDADPATDGDLIRLSDALLTLERDTARAVHP